MDTFIKGECKNKCPEAEIKLRENQKLLHILETVPGTEKYTFPKADRNKAVKAFARSAAGKKLLDPKSLRPPDVLLKTVYYLLGDVVVNKRVPWNVTYDFLMDRLRAVRQDMVIQNIPIEQSVCILQPIIRFYAYASYRLCNEELKYFDPVINNNHLQECLKRLLSMYDELDTTNGKSSEGDLFDTFLEDYQPEFEALYIIINMGNTTALLRSLNLPKHIRNNKLVKLATEISISCVNNNFVRLCRLLRKLPILHFAVGCLHLPQLRKKAFQIMAVAYNSKTLTVPADVIKELLFYDSSQDVIDDCRYYGLNCVEANIKFVKSDFMDSKQPVKNIKCKQVEELLSNAKLSFLLLSGAKS